MPAEFREHVELTPGERTLDRWAAEMVDERSPKGVAGWLILTTRRCLFFRRVGLFGGGKVETPPRFTVWLNDLRSVSSRESSMSIGYGDRVSIPGIELNGQRFRLGREANSAEVVAKINDARQHLGSTPVLS